VVEISKAWIMPLSGSTAGKPTIANLQFRYAFSTRPNYLPEIYWTGRDQVAKGLEPSNVSL
jgi:hypothetical protein